MSDSEVPGSSPMSSSGHPLLHLVGIAVDRVTFADLGAGEQDPPPTLSFFFGIERSSDVDQLAVTLTLRIEPDNRSVSSFILDVAMTGWFQRIPGGVGALSQEEFARVNAPAMLVPFVREFVTNLTARSRHGTIIFPPVNVPQLVAEDDPVIAEPNRE